eukprot:sb/3478818/
MNKLYKADEESEQAKDLAHALYDTAMLRSGYSLKDTVAFSERMDKLLRKSYSIDMAAKVEIPAEFEEEEKPAATEEVPLRRKHPCRRRSPKMSYKETL